MCIVAYVLVGFKEKKKSSLKNSVKQIYIYMYIKSINSLFIFTLFFSILNKNVISCTRSLLVVTSAA